MKIISKSMLAILVLTFGCIKKTEENQNYSQKTEIKKSQIQVSANGRYLQTADGKPFFYTGDTAWELFHRLNQTEADLYLENRKKLGFNVIQAVALAEIKGLSEPNAYGDFPLNMKNFSPDTTKDYDLNDSLAYDYWDNMDYIIDLAEKKGLFIALLPCWGEYVSPRFEKYTVFSDSIKGYEFGWFIANRFKKHNNIIWVLGGDRFANEKSHGISTWNAMAEGITDATVGVKLQDGKADFDATCMSYHAMYPSSIWFENQKWIDINMWGSYHEKVDNDRAFEVAYYQWVTPNTRPTINAEPPYEQSGINYDLKNGLFDDFDVRQQAYWSVFAGCAGHTYGNTSMWQFLNKKTYDSNNNTPSLNWIEALNLPGATQMQHLKSLMEKYNDVNRIPAQEILASNSHDATGHLQATMGKNFALIYIPTGKNIEVTLLKSNWKKFDAQWYNPKDGTFLPISSFENKAKIEFDPPQNPKRGNDWVLVLENNIK